MKTRRCYSKSPKRRDTFCGKLLPISEFFTSTITKDGFDNLCKSCRNAVKKRYADKPEIKKRKRAYQNSPRMKNHRRLHSRKRETKDKRNEREKKRRREDPVHKLRHAIRTRTNNFLRCKGIFKETKMVKLIGCSWEQLRLYIEKQFEPGMNWNNHARDGWHVDHIIPLAVLSDDDLQYPKRINKLFHFSNLRPMWARPNIQRNSLLRKQISEVRDKKFLR